MVNPNVSPEDGVTRYAMDRTQGPACAIAAGAATVYRNYYVPINGKIGQTSDNQLDCLRGVGALLGNSNESLWSMNNGYALCSPEGLKKISNQLETMNSNEKDRIRESLNIGLHTEIEVTDQNAQGQLISQAFCSTTCCLFNSPSNGIDLQSHLDSAYEATLCAAIINANRCRSNKYFTLN